MNKTNSSHVVLLVILIIIAVIMSLYYIKNKDNSGYNKTVGDIQKIAPIDTVKPPEVKASLSAKAELLKKVSTKEVLSAKDKADITSAISGGKINEYDFTAEELKLVMDALNRK